MKSWQLFAVISFLLVFPVSCDEFMLKKTVALTHIQGELTYNPSSQSIVGRTVCYINNKQDNPLNEIYFVCHPGVSVDYIYYNKVFMRFEQGEGYGYGIYRIAIPPLKPLDKATVTLEFHMKGPVSEDRFYLNNTSVFLDAKKIWLPIPFADIPSFSYSIKITTPKDYHAVLGSKMTSEWIAGNNRISIWDSEISHPTLTGNIFIGKFNRKKRGNVYFYSESFQHRQKVFKYANFCIDTYKNKLGYFPFSELHIVNHVNQYKGLEEYIDGEFLANTIHTSPNILSSTNLVSQKSVLNSKMSILPNNSDLKIFEILAHEISHAYISTILRFDDDFHLSMESMTEFMAGKLMEDMNPKFADLFIERNRLIMMNLFLRNNTKSNMWKYLYGVNALSSSFKNTHDFGFEYLNMLIEKYRFTTIRRLELYRTAGEMNRARIIKASKLKKKAKLINMSLLSLWENNKFYNLSLTKTGFITNLILPDNTPETFVNIKIQNTFPKNVSGNLIYQFNNKIVTNSLLILNSTETNVFVPYPIPDIRFESPFSVFEYELSDNQICFTKNPTTSIFNVLNAFYKTASFSSPNISIETNGKLSKATDKAVNWRTLQDDKNISQKINPDISFRFDSISQSPRIIYINAFKMLNNIPFSYVIIRVIKKGKMLQIHSIYDPTI